MLKFTYTHKFKVSVVVFDLIGFDFHIKNIDMYLICILDSIHIQYASNLFQSHVFVSFGKIGFPFQSLVFEKYRVWFKA